MDMLQPIIDRLETADLNKVAARADVSRKTLVRIIDRSNSPTFETAEKIVKALDALGVKKVRRRSREEQAEAAQVA